MSDVEDLHKLADLKERGIITQKEFDIKKAHIINRHSNVGIKDSTPKTKRGGFWRIPIGISVLLLIGFVINAGEDSSSSRNRSAQDSPSQDSPSAQDSPFDRVRANMPREQTSVIAAVDAARQQYAAGSNDMAKGAARPARARAVCAALPNRVANGWIGGVDSLSTNGEGKGVLKLEIDRDIHVKTWNNSLSDIADKTLIDPSSNLFATASKLQEGQLVRFSGNFFDSQTDCIRDSSLSLSGSIRNPEFIFSFQTLAPINQ